MASDQSTKQKEEEAKQPLAPEQQRDGISKRGLSTHVDGQGTGEPTRRSVTEGQPDQGTKPGGPPPSPTGR
jgi:hypothetical protein